MANKFSAVDLFCGAGGLTLGFKMANYRGYGFKLVAAVDKWKRATETYKVNHPEVKVITEDIRRKKVIESRIKLFEKELRDLKEYYKEQEQGSNDRGKYFK